MAAGHTRKPLQEKALTNEGSLFKHVFLHLERRRSLCSFEVQLLN